jgi:large subunit ribosomal protein L13
LVKVVDARDAVAGRLATIVAKMALEGETIVILNAEKAIITGSPKRILKDYLEKLHRGHPFKGPYTPRRPDRILRRIIRGMIPYKKAHGVKAFKRVKVFIGEPKEYEGKGRELEDASIKKRNLLKYMTIEELSKQIGGVK